MSYFLSFAGPTLPKYERLTRCRYLWADHSIGTIDEIGAKRDAVLELLKSVHQQIQTVKQSCQLDLKLHARDINLEMNSNTSNNW